MKSFKAPKGMWFNIDTQKWEKYPVRVKRKPPVQKQINSIKRQIKKEPSVFTQSELSGTLNATPVVSHLDPKAGTSNGVPTEGNKARLRAVRVRAWVKAASAVPETARIDIVLDRRPVAGTIATFNEIYLPVNTHNSMIHPLGFGRFKILSSFEGMVSTSTNAGMLFDRHIKLNLVLDTTTADSYTQATQNKNAILVVRWTTASASQPTYTIATKTMLIDDN